MPNTYINPLTDFGFKKLFGEEPNKDLLISLLNTLLPERHQIADLQYTKNEYDPKDRQRYEDSLKYLRDLKNSEETARLEGRLEGRIEVARNLLDLLDDETIAARTGLPCAAVAALRAGQG